MGDIGSSQYGASENEFFPVQKGDSHVSARKSVDERLPSSNPAKGDPGIEQSVRAGRLSIISLSMLGVDLGVVEDREIGLGDSLLAAVAFLRPRRRDGRYTHCRPRWIHRWQSGLVFEHLIFAR